MLKTIMTAAAMLFIATVPTNAEAEGSSQLAIKNYPALASLLEEMSKAASGGASLAAFYFSDKEVFSEDLDNCSAIKRQEAVSWFSKLVVRVFEQGFVASSEQERIKDLSSKGIHAFSQLIGRSEGGLQFCNDTESVPYTFVEYYTFSSSNILLSFELGFED